MFDGIKIIMVTNKIMNLPAFDKCTIAILGLGYVGLPLAIEFARVNRCVKSNIKLNRKVIGLDINETRINELNNNFDKTKEIEQEDLESSKGIIFTSDCESIVNADVYIITVPTPIDAAKIPYLGHLINASKIVGNSIKKRQKDFPLKSKPVIIYESTVYPGATEEVCIQEIERASGLDSKTDFFYGYSPERINPGDKKLKLTNILKITSGNNNESLEWIDKLYNSIIKAGTFKSKSIKIAEAAKVIENTQRDLNIALINELSLIFSKMDIDTLDVIEAASTKWNFLKFYPGIVGGHCIGVDPYYLTYKSQMIGYYPEVLLSGRRINDSMGEKIVEKLITNMLKNSIEVLGTNLLILGLTFKENCPDIRNTGVAAIAKKAIDYGFNIDIVDPHVDPIEAKNLYSLKISKDLKKSKKYSAIIVAVQHKEFKNINHEDWLKLVKEKYLIYDLKGIVPRNLKVIRP